MNKDYKILLLGIGSVGGIIAGKLLLCNFNCTLITNNESITSEIINRGIIINDTSKKDQLKVRSSNVSTDLNVIDDQFDFIFYMMKATEVASAIIKSKHLLKPTGYAVAFQNGIIDQCFSNIFGNRVIIASVVFNSIMNEPGVYTLSKTEKIIIGLPYFNEIKASVLNLKNILSNVTDCEVTDNIIGISWSKLAINCSINAITAISGRTLGEVLKKNFGKELFFSIYKETIDVATELGIKLEKIKIDPYILYSSEKTSFYKKCIQVLLINQIAKNYSSIYPSMLQDIKKGKKTEIEYLNGYISSLGKKLGISTPINDEMTSLIRKIELRYLNPEISHLRIAFELPKLRKSNYKKIQPT